MQEPRQKEIVKMNILRTEKKLCPCCMEEHDVQYVKTTANNIFKGVTVEYPAEYLYCDKADEMYEEEAQISENDISMKNAYREKTGLLTSQEIADIRATYRISQNDLCLLLGWGGKTITRYESHQVQDISHDTILRKLNADPEWFLQLLNAKKESLSTASYARCLEAGTRLFEQNYDTYLKSAVMARYARYFYDPQASGDKSLSLDTVVDTINSYKKIIEQSVPQ